VLSEFTDADAEAIFAYASNPRVAEMVTWDAHQSLEDSRGFLAFLASKASPQFRAWAIRDPQSLRAFGSISFSQYDVRGQIDYALSADHWGCGLVTEAAQAVLAWAWEEYPALMRVQAYCLPQNAGSRRVMEKCGMHFVELRPAAMVVKGRAVDLAVYAMERTK
jgi:ribosomal-protein-alanine N-acetyltransferase